MRFKRSLLLLSFLMLGLFPLKVLSQSSTSGFFYQTVVRDPSGMTVNGQFVNIRFSIHSASISGPLVWEESHLLQTDSKGLLKTIVGTGTSTGSGIYTTFQQIDWSINTYYLHVGIDYLGGTNFIDMGGAQFFSVPYSFHSNKTGKVSGLKLGNFEDTQIVSPAIGNLLKWNGNKWVAGMDNHSDTVLYALNAQSAVRVDTSMFAFNAPQVDSVIYATNSSLANNTVDAFSSLNSDSSVYSDTAQFAYSSAVWNRTGNSGSSSYFLGTVDNNSFTFKTNNLSRVVLNSNGSVSIGSTSGSTSFDLIGNDGMLFYGTFGSGRSTMLGLGTNLIWIPSMGAFRAEHIDDPLIEDSLGIYSAAFGYNNKVGKYSFVSGYNCVGGDYTVAMGRKSQASALGAYPVGSGVALGDSCIATKERCLAIGLKNVVTRTSSAAIGTRNVASAVISLAMGTNCVANANYSSALGYYSSTNSKQGSFVYADASSSAVTNATLNNQFVVRASGGTIFYSDPMRTTGVTLFPGSGSWSSVSDSTKKENISIVNCEYILEGITKLNISSWRYKTQKYSVRHIGPMAQDFYRLFGFGENNVTISSVDADGIIMAGIKAINQRLIQMESQLDTVECKVESNNMNFDELNKRLDTIESKIK